MMRVGLIQMAPVWLDRKQTTDKILTFLQQAADQGCDLVVLGEGLLPGYPFWLEHTGGARFNDTEQKQWFQTYATEAVQIERGDLEPITAFLKKHSMAAYLGIIERPEGRGGHSLYCSLIYVNEQGVIQSVHRKLMPTYEERLVWSIGDGHGLVTHKLKEFTVGGLNCWENWMPLARTSLYAQGENMHVAVWPGNERNTRDLTPVLAQEGRSFVLSVSGLMRVEDLTGKSPGTERMQSVLNDKNIQTMANGGSCLCAPDGSFLIEPQVGTEGVFIADVDLALVQQARQNFDPVGHYSRPDVFQVSVNRRRQQAIDFKD